MKKPTPKRIAKILDKMASGETLCVQVRESDVGNDLVYWFEPSGRSVGSNTVKKAISLGVIEGCGDGLFGESQTFRQVK